MAKPIEIDAPDFLRPDQNFYDQEPFTTLPETGLSRPNQTTYVRHGLRVKTALDRYK